MSQRHLSRRQLLVGSAAGTAAVWAAPAISTLGSASAAGSDCLVFSFVSANLTSPTWHLSPAPTYGVGTTLQTGQDDLYIINGDIDLVGNNTPWTPGGGFPDKSIDLNGSSLKILTVLSSKNTSFVALPAGNYTARLKVYGSIGPDSNIIGVRMGPNDIGATQVIPPTVVGAGSTTVTTLTGSVAAPAGSHVWLNHTSTRDNKGLFLISLEVFAESC